MSTGRLSLPWFAGLTCDHLYADCPNRMRGEQSLREVNWWDMGGPSGLDPYGTDVCGFCVSRYDRSAAKRVRS